MYASFYIKAITKPSNYIQYTLNLCPWDTLSNIGLQKSMCVHTHTPHIHTHMHAHIYITHTMYTDAHTHMPTCTHTLHIITQNVFSNPIVIIYPSNILITCSFTTYNGKRSITKWLGSFKEILLYHMSNIA